MKKLAIIGCGGIGEYHLNNFLSFPGLVELAGFCDLIPERAQRFTELAGSGKAYTNYRAMYDEVQPDMVFICIPPYCHGEIEFETIQRGIPFFVEKPLALDLELGRRIRDAAEAKGLITASGFQCRYSNLVEPNRTFCQENDIVFIDCTRIGGIPGAPWWRQKALSGGQIVEQTIHQFDIVRYVMGEPEEVCTYGTRGFVKSSADYDTDDCSVTIVKFQNGAIGTFSTGDYATSPNSFDSKLVFSAADKRAELKILSQLEIFGEKPPVTEATEGFVIKGDGALGRASAESRLYTQQGNAGILCDRTFIEAVISGDGSKIRSSYRDALRSVAFTLACNESMDTGKPVKVALD